MKDTKNKFYLLVSKMYEYAVIHSELFFGEGREEVDG